MRHAVLYLRRSTDMQEQSLGDQRKALEVYARDHDYVIIKEFVDDAVSGTSTEGRDAFKAMVKAALNGERSFEAILVWDIRRFSRGDVDEAGYYRHLLRQHGVEVLYIAENLTGDDVDDLIIGTKQWLARQESKDKSKVTIRGMLSLIEKGHWAGGIAPYGYARAIFDTTGQLLRVVKTGEPSRMAPGDYAKLVPGDPDHVKTLQRLFDLFVNRGLGYRAIASLFNQERLPGPSGGRWAIVTVQTLLRNPVYKGAVVWNKTSHGRFHVVRTEGERTEIRSIGKRSATRIIHNPPERWIVVESAHEPLISKELFAAAQAKRRTRSAALYRYNGRGADSPYLLTSMIRCGRCGSRMYGHTKRRKGHVYPMYVCGGFSQGGRSICEETYVHQDALEGYVLRRIKERYLESGQWLNLLDLLKVEFEALAQPHTDALSNTDKRLKEVEQKINLLLDTISPDNAALMNEKLRHLREEMIRLEQQRASLTPRGAITLDVTRAIEETLASLDCMEEVLTQATFRERKAFVRNFVGSTTVYPDCGEAVVGFYKIPQHDRIKDALEPLTAPTLSRDTEHSCVYPVTPSVASENDQSGVPAPFFSMDGLLLEVVHEDRLF